MTKRRHTVTDIVSAVYCEQKIVFDRRHGKATTGDLRKKAAQGTFEHLCVTPAIGSPAYKLCIKTRRTGLFMI
jgi:hypothetical protein